MTSAEAAGAPSRNTFDSVLGDSEVAFSGSAGVTQHYDVAGRVLRVDYSSAEVMSLHHRALSHLSRGPGSPDLTVKVWIGGEIDVVLADGPSSEARAGTSRVRGALDPAGQRLWMIDLDRSLALVWSPDTLSIPYWEQASPFRLIFHWWTSSLGLLQLHGGAVGEPSGGVLIVGAGGRGKSTTALACLTSGMRYVGDDYVVVSLADVPTVYSLHSTAKLERHHVATFPQLQGMVTNHGGPAEEKAVVYFDEAEGLSKSLPLKAILIPGVASQTRTTLSPISGQETLRAAAPSTILQLSGDEGVSFGRLAQLVRRLPHFRLNLGSDIATIAPTVGQLLEDLA